MMKMIAIVLILINPLHPISTVLASHDENALPQITIYRIGTKWNRIFPNTAAQNTTVNGLTFYSDVGDDLFLRCTAPFPIQWNFEGVISPTYMVHMQPPKRNITCNTFEITVPIYFRAGWSTDMSTSVRISCEQVGNPGITAAVFVYVTGNDNHIFVRSGTSTVTDSRLMPCAIKDPTVVPNLYRRTSNGTEEPVEDGTLRYHPVEGFHSDVEFNGVYTCRLDNSSLTITAITLQPSILDDVQFSPKLDSVRVFSEETIQFECYSKSKRAIKLAVDENQLSEMINVEYSTNYFGGMTANLSVHFGNNTRMMVSVKGRIICTTDERDKFPVTLKEWSFEFLRTPELILDNFRREIRCLSRGTPKTLQTLRCTNSMDCRFMVGQNCLENTSKCNYFRQKQFHETADSLCWIRRYGNTWACVSMPYFHMNGVAECYVDGLVKRWEYFISLDFLKYSSWHDVPKSGLIRMDEVSPILYTNETSKFFCMAASFLFADSISFELEFSDGKRQLLQDSGSLWNISRPGGEHSRKIDEQNVIGILEIQLQLNAASVHCIAPWWNASDDGLRTERKFETRHLMRPQLRLANHQGDYNNETFHPDDMIHRLTCFTQGEPYPSYTWYYGNVTVSEIFPELKTSTGADGEGYLEFPGTISSKYNGQYRCVAENRVGVVDRRFNVSVSDERRVPNQNSFYPIVAVIVIVFVLVLILLLAVFVRKYKAAKKMVRSLTDSELNEFFDGRPELLAKRRQSDPNDHKNANVEIADLMPYNKELEIPLDDLEFDSSENSFLGSGAFCFVVRGKIISNNKPVAVKISKPTADVPMFKSLLSEVKIMTFVGEHENVVTLIGVCTQNIRDRSIHIATDVCELGSLDKFLRKCRSSFIDLIDENHKIDLTALNSASSFLSYDDGPSMSTVDLINVSAQIAKGMEYLASKSVIHADLAARNVLLTRDRTAKISDFGLSRKLYGGMNYVKKSSTPMPWRWLAIESLTTLTFSTCSDVWAFGVTLFEIFTLGNIPFPNEQYDIDFITRLSGGMRMGRPEYSTPEIYLKIASCWEKETGHRPSFTHLRCYFEEMASKYRCTANSDESTVTHCDDGVHYVGIDQFQDDSDHDHIGVDKTFEP